MIMKKVLMLATAAILVTGVAFAIDGGGKKKKKCAKGKSCQKTEMKACCKKKAS
jgi:hypothetical protein